MPVCASQQLALSRASESLAVLASQPKIGRRDIGVKRVFTKTELQKCAHAHCEGEILLVNVTGCVFCGLRETQRHGLDVRSNVITDRVHIETKQKRRNRLHDSPSQSVSQVKLTNTTENKEGALIGCSSYLLLVICFVKAWRERCDATPPWRAT